MAVKVRQRPKGSGIWWVFIDHQGKRKAKKIGSDKRLAREVAKKIEARLVLEGTGVIEKRPKVPTLKEYVYGWQDSKGEFRLGWFDKVANLSLKNSTKRGYHLILHSQLIPAFGSKRLDEITPRMIGDFISNKVMNSTRSATARNIKNCLSAVLRHAANPDGYITTNPARGVPVPKPEKETPAREPDPFTWEERLILEETFKEHFPEFYHLIVCGFRTGLRIGELLALKWEDIDFRNKLIFVQRNITRGRVTTPKSRSSKRKVRMTAQLVDLLHSHRKRVMEKALRKGCGTPPEWVFHSQDGGPLNYGNFVHRVWNRAMEKSGLRRRTPHDMRHTYVTLRLSKGDSLAEVSKEMGHASTDITYRTYYKWLPKESRSDIDELDGTDVTKRNLSATRNEERVNRFG
jgi:integrase